MTELSTETKRPLISLTFTEWINEAKSAIIRRDFRIVEDVDRLITHFLGKKLAGHDFETLAEFNKLIVSLVAWFFWGGETKWTEAVKTIERWRAFSELIHAVAFSESPQKAYRMIKKSSYGELLVKILYRQKALNPGDIRRLLNIRSRQQVSRMIGDFEKEGLVLRESYGKNVLVSLAPTGVAVYKEFLRPQKQTMINIEILRFFIERKFYEAQNLLKEMMQEDQANPLHFLFLGIVKLQLTQLTEAGNLFSQAMRIGLSKEEIAGLLSLLKGLDRLSEIRQKLVEMNLQKDEIVEKIKPALKILAVLCEIQGNFPRANQFYQLQGEAFREMA